MERLSLPPRRHIISSLNLKPTLQLKPIFGENLLYPNIVYVAPKKCIMPRLIRRTLYREYQWNNQDDFERYPFNPRSTYGSLESLSSRFDQSNVWQLDKIIDPEGQDIPGQASSNIDSASLLLQVQYNDMRVGYQANDGARADDLPAAGAYAAGSIDTADFGGDDFAAVVTGPRGFQQELSSYDGTYPFKGEFKTSYTHYSDFGGSWNDNGDVKWLSPEGSLRSINLPLGNSGYVQESGTCLDVMDFTYEFEVVFQMQDRSGNFLPGQAEIIRIDKFDYSQFHTPTIGSPTSTDITLGTWSKIDLSTVSDFIEVYESEVNKFKYYLNGPSYCQFYVDEAIPSSDLLGWSNTIDLMSGLNAVHVEQLFRVTARIGDDYATGWVVFHLTPVLAQYNFSEYPSPYPQQYY